MRLLFKKATQSVTQNFTQAVKKKYGFDLDKKTQIVNLIHEQIKSSVDE